MNKVEEEKLYDRDATYSHEEAGTAPERHQQFVELERHLPAETGLRGSHLQSKGLSTGSRDHFSLHGNHLKGGIVTRFVATALLCIVCYFTCGRKD